MTDFKPGDRVEFYDNGKESIHHNKVYTVKEVIDKDTVTFEEEVPGFGGLWATWAFRLAAEEPKDTGYTVEAGLAEGPQPRYLSDEELRFNIFMQQPGAGIESLEDAYQWVRNGWAKVDPDETSAEILRELLAHFEGPRGKLYSGGYVLDAIQFELEKVLG